MISQLSGTVVWLGATSVVLEVSGVGFGLSCPPATSSALRVGQQALLHTHLVVREDSLTLFGFTEPAEREAFTLVQSVSGVGPKLALAIVSVLPPHRLAAAVRSEDIKALTAVPGIGTKGAQRLLIELKDKVLALGVQDASSAQPAVSVPQAEVWREQVSAGLQGLGWSAKDAEKACEAVAPLVAQNPSLGVGALMKAALQSLARA